MREITRLFILLSISSIERGSNTERESLYLEKEILMPLAGTGKALIYTTTKWWSQLKAPGAAIYANRHYLQVIFLFLLHYKMISYFYNFNYSLFG